MLVYHPNDWRLFLDTSKHRLKCTLFHNGKVYSAVPVGHFVYLRKEHNDIKTMIDLLKYHEHNWTTGMPYAYIVKDSVVSQEKIIFPPLHIKLGLMKQFVKVLNTDDECFQHIFSMLPDLSFEKITAGIFNGPKIRALVHNQEFARKMNDKERTAGFHLWR